MRSPSFSIVAVVAFVVLARPLAAQELPLKELDDAIKAAKEARIQELTGELKTVQAAIKNGGKGFGDNHRDAIINARKKLAEVEASLAEAKKSNAVPELDVEKLAVGQIGVLFRAQSVSTPVSVPNGTGGVARFNSTTWQRLPVEVQVEQIADAHNVLVAYRDKGLWLRKTTAGLVTGQKLTLDSPVKIVGTKKAGDETVFELAFFAADAKRVRR